MARTAWWPAETPGGDKRARALCAVVQAFKNQCFAVATDPQDATPGVGWAVEGDEQAAARRALARCAETAGEDRRDAWEVTHSAATARPSRRPDGGLLPTC